MLQACLLINTGMLLGGPSNIQWPLGKVYQSFLMPRTLWAPALLYQSEGTWTSGSLGSGKMASAITGPLFPRHCGLDFPIKINTQS